MISQRPLNLKEGEKVKLNYDQITGRKSWHKYNPVYKAFVEANKDRIFTVEFDEVHETRPSLVCLAEDDKEVKSLWWEGDLIRVEKDN